MNNRTSIKLSVAVLLLLNSSMVTADEETTLTAQVGSALHELDLDAGKKLTALTLWLNTQNRLQSDLNARIENMRYELSVKERSLHAAITKELKELGGK